MKKKVAIKKHVTSKAMTPILWFNEISIKDIDKVGGKNASLGEMYRNLTKKGINVPNGFAVTAESYWAFLEHNDLKKQIKQTLHGLDVTNVKELSATGKKVRDMILKSSLPEDVDAAIESAYVKLTKQEKVKSLAVAVRSSATAEDLPDASFAGQQETYLNIKGVRSLKIAVKKCIASLFTDRAISYREQKGFDHSSVALSVTIQTMVRSDVGVSGVMFTLDTESGFPGVVLINSSYGLGEYVVKGRVTPDQFYLFKEGLNKGKDAVISKILGTKEVKLVYGKTQGTRQTNVKKSDQNAFSITQKEAVQLAKWGMMIEEYYKKPQDIEWAKDGKTGKLYIVQARPETVKSQTRASVIETYELKQTGTELLRATAVGQRIGAGNVRVIEDPKDMKKFKPGDVLVTRITDPDWEPIMRIAAAIVTEQGGKTSHAAIVSRELGVPCLVGARNARKVLKTGQQVTVSCAEGDEGLIYKGILPFEVKRTEIKKVEKTKTKMMMNVGDPDNAFNLSYLPNDGVGLAREEFIFSNFIRIHPLALVHYKTLADKVAKKKIADITRGYKNKTEYGVDKLAEGIARIATAFYPKDVVLRLSDFKSNEYATLLGGKEFEPEEENPMIGWRGASRYYSKEYKPAFNIECKAIKKVRDDWGLDNVIVMVPFCRTPHEGEQVLRTMQEFGLTQGENKLKVYVMCEIPSNVVLAEEFARLFDGFSIGSNDLTQLTLGVDRDSNLVSHVYDERNEAVTKLIREVIKTAHKFNRKIGICGQAPSDYPEFAEMLVKEKIDSISLNPDTVISTRERIARVEKTLGKRVGKTSPSYLGLVSAFAVFAAGFIMLGGGCSVLQDNIASMEQSSTTAQELTVAQIRQKIEQKIKEQQQNRIHEPRIKLQENNFARFSVLYPEDWTVKNWNGGVTISHEKTGEYISFFNQLVDHPITNAMRTTTTIDGVEAILYVDVLLDNTGIHVLEIPQGEGVVLEINSNSARFEDILATFRFTSSTGDPGDRALNHWDVREKRVCVQMITYARQVEGATCQAFSTPCDVPGAWDVCDSDSSDVVVDDDIVE